MSVSKTLLCAPCSRFPNEQNVNVATKAGHRAGGRPGQFAALRVEYELATAIDARMPGDLAASFNGDFESRLS
jgi:hypothetical protein